MHGAAQMKPLSSLHQTIAKCPVSTSAIVRMQTIKKGIADTVLQKQVRKTVVKGVAATIMQKPVCKTF